MGQARIEQIIIVSIVADTVTYLPMTGFTGMYYISIEMAKYTDKFIMNNEGTVQKQRNCQNNKNDNRPPGNPPDSTTKVRDNRLESYQL